MKKPNLSAFLELPVFPVQGPSLEILEGFRLSLGLVNRLLHRQAGSDFLFPPFVQPLSGFSFFPLTFIFLLALGNYDFGSWPRVQYGLVG